MGYTNNYEKLYEKKKERAVMSKKKGPVYDWQQFHMLPNHVRENYHMD